MNIRKLFERMKEKAFFLLTVFMILGINLFGRPLQSLDELWQFSMGRNVAQRLLPYRDFNLPVPPFSVFLGGLGVRIFGDGLLSYRILGFFIALACMVAFYDVLNTLKVDRRVAFCLGCYGASFFSAYFTFDYNWLVVLFMLWVLKLLLGQNQETGRIWFVVGCLTGCSVITKQSTGGVLALGVFGLCFLLCYRKAMSCILWYLLGGVIPVLGCSLWILQKGLWKAFLDYVFGGLTSFARENTIDLFTFAFRSGPLATAETILSCLILTIGVRKLIKSRNHKSGMEFRNMLILLCVTGLGMVVIFPITDGIHFAVALFPLLLLGSYELRGIREEEKPQQIPGWLLGAIALICIGFSCYGIFGEQLKWSDLPCYKGIRIQEAVEETVQEVLVYLESYSDREVLILDGTAVLYKLVKGQYTKNFDMCLSGNMGTMSAEQMKAELLGKRRILLLASEGTAVNWQVPEILSEIVRENANYIGQINKYDVYLTDENE